MSQLFEELREAFSDEETRYAYAEAFLNASVAAQIKKFRGNFSQEELAVQIGTKQSGISRLENVNYSAWKVETLRKLARAFGLRLRISFEEWGTLVPEIENFRRGILRRRRFAEDPNFHALHNTSIAKSEDSRGSANSGQDLPRRIPPAPSGSIHSSANAQPLDQVPEAKTENAIVVDAPTYPNVDQARFGNPATSIEAGRRRHRTNMITQRRLGGIRRGR